MHISQWAFICASAKPGIFFFNRSEERHQVCSHRNRVTQLTGVFSFLVTVKEVRGYNLNKNKKQPEKTFKQKNPITSTSCR